MVFDKVAKQNDVIGAVAIRRRGKSWALTTIMEIARLAGWNFIVFDTKGDDIFLDEPARGWQARILRAKYGLEPRGWDTIFYTFNFPYGLADVPLKFELAPIAMRMVSFGHLRRLGSLLTDKEKRLLIKAYLRAKGPKARLEEIIEYVVRSKGADNGLLLALLTSGYFANESPLEPENLVQIAKQHDFVVINTSFMESSVQDLGYFGALTVMNALKNYLKTVTQPLKLAIVFREMGETARRYGTEGPQWYLAREVESFVRIAGQGMLSVSKVFWEAQDVKDVPKPVLHNTSALFVHPATLMQEEQLKEIKKHFSVDSSLIRRAEAIGDQKGIFFLLDKMGEWTLVPFPPPLSMRVREISSMEGEHVVREEVEIVNSLLPRRDMDELIEEAAARYAMWVEEGELILQPSTFAVEVKLTMSLAALLFALRHAPYNPKGRFTISRKDLSRYLLRRFGRKIAMYLGPAKLIPSLKKGVGLLRAMGIDIGRASDGELVFSVDWDRFVEAYDSIEEMVETKLGVGKQIGD